MIRKLFGLLLATALLGSSLGAATQAGAAEFHCAAEPCRYTLAPDGTGATAHHVIVIQNTAGESLSVTCKQLTGESVFNYPKTTSSILFGALAYDQCNANGEPVNINMNGCLYEISVLGTVRLSGCNVGKQMEIELPTKCVYKIPEQDFAAGSFAFHNIGSFSFKEITMEAFLGGIRNMVVTATGTKAQCLIDVSHTPLTGKYTTGNTIFRAESTTGFLLSAWYE